MGGESPKSGNVESTATTHLTLRNNGASDANASPPETQLASTSTHKAKSTKPHDTKHAVAPISGGLPSILSVRRNKSLVHLFFLAGIVFCCLDVCYFVYHIEFYQYNKPVQILDKYNKALGTIRDQDIESNSTTGNVDMERYKDKKVIIDLLRDAGFADSDLSPTLLEQLPTWSEVVDLYGSEPIFIGLDTCERFRQHSDAPEHFIGTAGTFNTGTNLMSQLLEGNCQMPERMRKYGSINKGIRWQVPWGKHTPVDDEDFRLSHHAQGDTNVQATEIMPIVTIRDPALWMPSMCRHSYAMEWEQPPTEEGHCPNLVATEADHHLYTHHRFKAGEPIPVSVEYAKFTKHYSSMVHHWNKWYSDYLNAPWPRVLVRFEDLIFHPRNVTQTVCECAGGELVDPNKFMYIVESAKVGKVHGTSAEKTGYVDAIIKYGRSQHRWSGMHEPDLEFAHDTLDPILMRVFKYQNVKQNMDITSQ